MSFTTQYFSAPVSAAPTVTSYTSGTFTATITGIGAGALMGSWSYTGTYNFFSQKSFSGSISFSGTLTGYSTNGANTASPWSYSLQSGSPDAGGWVDLTQAYGQYSLSVDFLFQVPYRNEYGDGWAYFEIIRDGASVLTPTKSSTTPPATDTPPPVTDTSPPPASAAADYSALTPALNTSYFRHVTLADQTKTPQAWTPPVQRTLDPSKVPWGVSSSAYNYTATDPNGGVASQGDVVTIGSYVAAQSIQHFNGPVASYPVVGGHTLEGTGITIGDPIGTIPVSTDPVIVRNTTIIQNIYTDYGGKFLQDLIKLSEINLKAATSLIDKDLGTVLNDLSSLLTQFKSDLNSRVGTDLGQKAADAFLNFVTTLRLVDDNSFSITEQPGGSAVTGGPQKDAFMGTPFNDKITGGAGDDIIIGGDGIDTAIFSGPRANYTITPTETGYRVSDKTAADGTDSLSSVDRLQFSDKFVAIDISGNAGEVYRLYQAAFDRTPDAAGLSYWINYMDHGNTLAQVASGFTSSNEFAHLYGVNATNEQFVTRLYSNVLNRVPEQAGYDWWINSLSTGAWTREQALAGFSESAENQANVIGVIANGIEYTPFA